MIRDLWAAVCVGLKHAHIEFKRLRWKNTYRKAIRTPFED